MDRRDFLTIAVTAPLAAAACASVARDFSFDFELDEATIPSLQAGMQSGKRTARSITQLYLDRIRQLNRSGPVLNAIIEVNPEALKIAETLDAERRMGRTRGPMHGIPVLLKDNISTLAPLTTTAGSLALQGCIPPHEAAIARRLREAGAIILGKANMSEWANFRSGESTSGWSARGGQCRNPYALNRSPFGSSSGSAVAAAANLCAVTIGTETDGSIVSPAAVCGVVGVKPTLGLVSTDGVIPVAHSQDVPGPICRSVADAAIVLSVLSGNDYVSSLKQDGLRKSRIGIVRDSMIPDRKVEGLMNSAFDVLKREGAELIDVEGLSQEHAPEFEVLLYEFKADLNAYFATLDGKFRELTLRKVIEFNEQNRDMELAFFGQEIFQQADAKGPLTDTAYLKALSDCRRISRTEGIDAVIARHKLDAFVAPTCGPASVINPGNGDMYVGNTPSLPAIAGYPHVTVPAGLAGELPVGISFFGGAQSESVLFRIAFAFEQATKLRRKPLFL